MRKFTYISYTTDKNYNSAREVYMVQNLQKVIESLDLLYYEYDKKTDSLRADAECSQKNIFDELIKITHALTTHNITFYVDSQQRVFLNKKESLVSKIKRVFDAVSENMRNKKLPIYILSDKKVKWAKNLPVFRVEYLPHSSDFSGYDALVFTSKNAIKAVDSQSKNYKNIPSYVLAPQSAKVLKNLDANVAYVGKTKHGNEFAHEISEKLRGKRVLYVRGESVVSDLVHILRESGVECDERIVYKTECIALVGQKKLPKASAIIFSSPSTIECFFQNMEWDASYSAISIGKTTASYFPKHIEPVVAQTTSLDACVQKAIELLCEKKSKQ